MEQRISLREANQHLSRYIEAVQKGQEIVITRRGEFFYAVTVKERCPPLTQQSKCVTGRRCFPW